MNIANLTLEMSLKPFTDASPETVDKVLSTLFEQWGALVRNASQLSILLWAADGSEILDYAGSLDESFEWAKYIGVANPRWEGPDPNDPDKQGIHWRPVQYTPDPPDFTYRWLKDLAARMKSSASARFGKPVKVVATFDPGPEFAKSDFKYRRHPEISMGDTMGRASFVCCYATLKGDSRRYASFPDGIPDGTSFGTFLGRQAQAFLSDLGFDAIWLSNGFGFGLDPWTYRGALFDGERFMPEKAAKTRELTIGFWRDFSNGCRFPVQTRGSNMSAGIDLASDAVPLREIYDAFKPQPPPNSPWAALNGDFGLELGGWMSHIAGLPEGTPFLYRFYTHDPWFLNSPWLDRYGREAHDIYLPLAVSNLDAAGRAITPSLLSILTVDDSYGRMPDKVPNEVIPRLLEGFEHAPDKPGPIVWIHPFDEMHELLLAGGRRLDETLFCDTFVCGAINQGLPLNTVVSSANFVKGVATNPAAYGESILFAPVALLSIACVDALIGCLKAGGRLMLYGPVSNADERILGLLNLLKTNPLEGEFDLSVSSNLDSFKTGERPAKITHIPLVSGGGLDAVLADASDGDTKVLASADRGSDSRILALSRSAKDWNGGRLVWIRGGMSGRPARQGHLLSPLNPAEHFFPELLPRLLLQEFGWSLLFEKYSWDSRCPVVVASRSANAFLFSGYFPDSAATRMRVRLPQGVPVFSVMETFVEGGAGFYHMPKSWHRECRVFIEQDEAGMVSCQEAIPHTPGVKRRILLTGLKGASVKFYHEPGSEGKVSMLLNPNGLPFLVGKFLDFEKVSCRDGEYLHAGEVTGDLLISW